MVNSIREALLPFSIVSFVLGIDVLEYPLGRPRIYLSCSYIIILWIAWTYYTFFCTGAFDTLSTNYSGMISALTIFGNIFTIFISAIWGLRYRKKLGKCFKDLVAIDDTFEIYGVPKEYKKLYKLIFIGLAGWLSTTLLLNVYFSICLSNKRGPEYMIIPYLLNYPVHVNGIIDLRIWIILGYTATRFDRLNKLIADLLGNAILDQANLFESSVRRKPDTIEGRRMMWIMMHLHLELCLTTRELNTVFEVQMCLETVSYFLWLIGLPIYTYEAVISWDEDVVAYGYLCVVYAWAAIFFIKLYILNYVCESITIKANKTNTIVIKIINSMRDTECRKEVSQFIFQLMRKPLKFSGMGLFTFGYNFMQTFVASMTTIIIIILQMSILPLLYYEWSTSANDTVSE